MRIASLLPSATEVAAALGLTDQLVGVTHECDYPPAVKELPKLTRSTLPPGLSSAEVDAAVSQVNPDEHTVYELNVQLLAELEPDLVLTQSLCEVCAVARAEVDEAVCTLPRAANVLSLDPTSLEDMLGDIRRLAVEAGLETRAEAVIAALRARLDAVRQITSGLTAKPTVFAAEWLDPLFCAGHWLPEMVSLAGGTPVLAKPAAESERVEWQQVLDAAPEAIVMMPCGFDAEGALGEARWLTQRPGWSDLPAVRSAQVYIVDANAYFARPGPRLVDGVEILARLLHPSRFTAPLGAKVAYKLTPGTTDRFEAAS